MGAQSLNGWAIKEVPQQALNNFWLNKQLNLAVNILAKEWHNGDWQLKGPTLDNRIVIALTACIKNFGSQADEKVLILKMFKIETDI